MLLTIILTVLVFVTAIYLVSLYIRDASIMDIFWGVGFILIAAQSLYLAFYSNLDLAFPKLIIGLMVLIWGLRLSLHIGLRHGGEDPRYVAWRVAWGRSYIWRSYLQIFILQGALMLVIASPIILLASSTVSRYNSTILWTGVGVWLLGLLFETVADIQLSRFKSNPANKGRLLTSGLWSISRHPNYFGEALLWFGVSLVALSAQSVVWWQLLIGPIVILFLVRFVSGVPMLEEKMRRNPQFAHYALRTNVFVPWFRR